MTVREPEETGRETFCRGGPVEWLSPPQAETSAEKRVEQLRSIWPDGVTMCPMCYTSLKRAAGGTMPFSDISYYLIRAFAP